MNSNAKKTNPIIKMDYPDPDVIYVNGTYYMISTTMHYMPGAEILRSYNLVDWEHASYIYDRLDSTEGQRLCGDKHIYGKGMWAASIRYHEGFFYVVFVANDTQKTYLYRSESIMGPWTKSFIEGFYHDSSLLFDNDKAYLVYGNTDIYLTELNSDLTAPAEGGLHRCILSDAGNSFLGYEGSHLYKIDGRYYLFLIHSKNDRWRRVEACFSSDSLEGEFTGGDIFDDDMGFRNSGIAQGGIVEGPKGTWNAVLFQDSGAVGRLPVLIPVKWIESDEGKRTAVFGEDGKAPEYPDTEDMKAGYSYSPLTDSDDFRYNPEIMYKTDKEKYGCFGLRSIWQFNHEPDMSLIECDSDNGILRIKTDKLVDNIYHARNILTQRMTFPRSIAEVTVDGAMLNDGDVAGLAAFQGDYAYVGIKKESDKLYAVMTSFTNRSGDIWDLSNEKGVIQEKIELKSDKLRVRVEAVFNDETGDRDIAVCGIYPDGRYSQIGSEHKLNFRLDHFTGCRFGLFVYSEKETGGSAGFSDFELL
ncbi:Beta-xylosidase [Lachnospiraceae bacterium]|nr:Beta-xylosidase [Lachnospiraceae bacterium]